MADDADVRMRQLEQRVELLESYLRALQRRLDGEVADSGIESRGDSTEWSAPPSIATWPPPQPAPAATPRNIAISSETILKWGGVGLVVLAIGFAVSTAISRGWIGPELQLAGALAMSAALIVTGVRLRPTRPAWTHALCVGGIAALYTTFASNLFLDQANSEVAYVSTAVVGVGGAVLAHWQRSEWVAAAGVLGAAIGWFVIADGEPPVVASSIWIVGIVALTVALSVRQQWHASRVLAHAVGLVGMLPIADEATTTAEQGVVLAAALLLAASLVRVPSIGDLSSTWQQLDVQLAIAPAPWAVGVLVLALDLEGDAAIGTAALAIASGSAGVAIGLQRSIRRPHFVSLLIGASVALSIGLAVVLSTTAAFMALAVQGAGLVLLSRSLGGSLRVFINAGVVLLVAGVFALGEMIEAWDTDAAVGDDLAHLVILIALAVAAWLSGEHLTQRLGALAVLALLLVWLGSVLVHLPQGQAAVSVSWAVVGTLVLLAGAIRKIPEVGATGLGVLALTVGKLLTVDLQEVDTLWRAGLFLVVGLGLLRLGFMLPRLMGGPAPPEDDAAR